MPTSNRPLRELRIALAMRGGVSLAVWMAGACSEIDSLRRAQSPADEVHPSPAPGSVADLYGRLLEAAGYSSVRVDVVAGASAGGLNGALMGCSVVHDMPFNQRIRDLWLQLGDLGKLARSVKGGAADSALDGDGEFYRPLAKQMQELTANRVSTDFRFDLSLTGTLLDARPTRRHQDLGPAIKEARNRARFRFRHLPRLTGLGLPADQLSDFGAGDGKEAALERLAYAARATSSFPGAFEPASIGYAPDSAVPPERAGIPPSHHGVFSESRPIAAEASDRDYVIDGGVLDNIPVAWAIRTIAAAPANIQVDRWLVYMQPLRFAEQKRRPTDAPEPGIRETVKRAKALQSGTETLTDDIDELERVRSSSLRRAGFAQVLEYALGQVPIDEETPEFLDKLFERALSGAAAYRDRMNVIEKDRVRHLWTDPISVLGVDVLGYSFLEAINSDDMSTDDRSELLRQLRLGEYEGVIDAADLPAFQASPSDPSDPSNPSDPAARRDALCAIGRRLRNPQHLARAVALLLDTARGLGEPGLAVKGSLYELRHRIELLVACHDRYLAAVPPLKGRVSPNELIRRAAWRLQAQQQQDSWLPVWSEDEPGDGWPVNTAEDLIDELVTLAQALAVAAPPPPDASDGGAPVTEHSSGAGQRALINCLLLAAKDAANQDAATEAVLAAVELLCGPLRPDPLAESSQIRFHMLSAANQSPYPGLRPGGEDLTVEAKLAGNQIANFGAFLSAQWRHNDWIWGRLDAAVSLVEIVAAKAENNAEVTRALFEVAGPLQSFEVPTGDLADDDPRLADLRRTAAEALVVQLHERILREELPLLVELDVGPPSDELLARVAMADEVPDVEPLLKVGKRKVKSLIALNPSLWKVTTELGLVAGSSWGTDSVEAGWDNLTDKAAEAWKGTKKLSERLRDKLPW